MVLKSRNAQRFAIVGGHVLTKTGFTRADILVEKDMIAGIGNCKGVKDKINAASCLVVPGLTNMHAHMGETIFRGTFEFSNLQEYIDKTEKTNLKMHDKSKALREISSSETIIEFLRSGITTVWAGRCDQACEVAGIRSFSGYMLMQSEKLQKYVNNFEVEFREFTTKIGATVLSNPFLFLHSLTYATKEIIGIAKMVIKEKHFPLMIHVAETIEEEKMIRKKTGRTSVRLLDENGLITGSTILVHCCNVTDSDIDIIKKRNATVVLCPTSNIRLKNNIPPFDKILKKGINVCVGTDGLATTTSKNIIDECLFLKDEFKTIKNFDWMTLITTNPAKALKINTGPLCKGYAADISVFEMKSQNNIQKIKNIDVMSILSMLKVKDVICAGNPLILDGKMTTMDEKKVESEFASLNRVIKDLWI